MRPPVPVASVPVGARLFVGLLVVGLLVVAACGGSDSRAAARLDAVDVPATISVRSPAFASGSAIPARFTCDGAGVSPAVAWSAVPARTRAIAVVVDDPDAPGGTFVHWVVINLTPSTGSLAEDARGVELVESSAGRRAYAPPCPPHGAPHHYRFTVFALDDYVCAPNGDTVNEPGCDPPSTGQALQQIRGDAIAKGSLVGVYQR